MGIFTNQSDFFNEGAILNVEEAVGYDNGVYSAQIAQIEGLQNHLALFEGGIKTDIQEALMISEGVNDEEVMAFSESVIGDMLKRIKEFFMKLWSKIKAIFKGFMARIDSVWIKSNKEFINKYKKDIIGKDLTDFEVKFRKEKSSPTRISFNSITSSEIGKLGGVVLVTAIDVDDAKVKKARDDFDSDKFREKLLGSFIGNTSGVEEKEFEKEAFDAYYEDEDSNEVSQSDISTIMTEMMSFKKNKNDLKKKNDEINKAMNDIVKNLDKRQSEVLKKAPVTDSNKAERISATHVQYGQTRDDSKVTNTDNDKRVLSIETDDKNKRSSEISNYQAMLGLMSQTASIVQSCVLKATGVSMKIIDFGNKQNRKILARAVAYKRKKDEDTDLMMEAMAELAEWESDVVSA